MSQEYLHKCWGAIKAELPGGKLIIVANEGCSGVQEVGPYRVQITDHKEGDKAWVQVSGLGQLNAFPLRPGSETILVKMGFINIRHNR
jgi:hypothetical protein